MKLHLDSNLNGIMKIEILMWCLQLSDSQIYLNNKSDVMFTIIRLP